MGRIAVGILVCQLTQEVCGGTKPLFPWQCKKYRDQLPPSRRAQLQAKLRASELFKDKKTLYPKRCQGRGLGVQGSSEQQWLMTSSPACSSPSVETTWG